MEVETEYYVVAVTNMEVQWIQRVCNVRSPHRLQGEVMGEQGGRRRRRTRWRGEGRTKKKKNIEPYGLLNAVVFIYLFEPPRREKRIVYTEGIIIPDSWSGC